MNKLSLSLVVSVVVSFCCLGSARAANGYLSGRFVFYSDAVGSCATPPCTGSNFPATHVGAGQGVKQAKLKLYDSFGTTIGNGYTHSDGTFTIYWDTGGGGTPTNWSLRIYSTQRDGRFSVKNAAGFAYNTSTSSANQPARQLQNGQTISIANANIGALPEWTVYDNAVRAYNNSLWTSGLMQANFYGVVVEFPDASDSGAARTTAPQKKINLGFDRYKGSLTLAHEIGHVAAWLVDPYFQTVVYSKLQPGQACNAATCPSPGSCVSGECRCPSGNCAGSPFGWSLRGTEWRAAAFEEGMAELTSAVTHWFYTAPNPIDCYTDTANCVTPLVDQYTDLEVVLLGICPTEQYNPVTVTRLLWDLNDDHNDPTYTDAFTMAYWEMLANLDFPDGYNDDESNEPWAAPISPATVPSLIDNENGRSVTDYLGHVPYNVLTQQNFNCQP